MDSPINMSIGSSTVLEEDSTEYYCFFILASKSCCPKTHRRFLVLNHLDFQNHVSPLVEGGSLPSRSQSDSFKFWQNFNFTFCRLSGWHQKADSLKIAKAAMKFD